MSQSLYQLFEQTLRRQLLLPDLILQLLLQISCQLLQLQYFALASMQFLLELHFFLHQGIILVILLLYILAHGLLMLLTFGL